MIERGASRQKASPDGKYAMPDGSEGEAYIRGYQTATVLTGYAMMNSILVMAEEGASLEEIVAAAKSVTTPLEDFIPDQMKQDLKDLRDENYG